MKAICIFFATLISALAVPGDPGNTAIGFLEKVRAGNIDLKPGGDTALSAQTSEDKRQQIAGRLKRMIPDFDKGPFEIGNVKIDGDLAAAIVRNGGSFDPRNLRVFAVALLKQGETWSATPVPASFENSGLGFTAPLRKRIADLEDWMLREQLTDLENFRAQSQAQMRVELEKTLPASLLKSWNSRQTAERFLLACQTRNFIEFCALSGGHASVLPEDWALRHQAANAAMNAAPSNLSRPWRQLVSKEIIRVPLSHQEDPDQACFTVACLDPAGNPPRSTKPKIELLQLKLSKPADGIWQIDLQQRYLIEPPARETDDDAETIPVSDQLALFTQKLAELYPISPVETAEKARDLWCNALRSEQAASWIPLINLTGNTEEICTTCENAAKIWWGFRNPAESVQPVPLALHEIGKQAAFAIQGFSIRNPDRTDLKIFYFENTEKGWLWNPTPTEETAKSFQEWINVHRSEWQDQWSEILLANSTLLEKFPEDAAPSDEEARKLVESFIAATANGAFTECAKLTARLDKPDSKAALLRNLSYELNNAKKANRQPKISEIHRGQIVTAVGVMGKSASQLYPIIQTSSGPKILLEFDLAALGSRSRDFLNKESLGRLRKSSPSAADELKKLLSGHAQNAAATGSP